MADEQHGLEAPDSGKAVLHDQGKRWTLRRPLTGEFRDFAEGLDDNLSRAIERQNVYTANAEQAAAEATEAGRLPDLRANAASYDQMQLQENYDWIAHVVKTLGDKELPPLDECPIWMLNRQLFNRLINHWVSVPEVVPGN